MHGVVIAGTHSGCGKTTVTLGLMAAFRKKGLKVQPFKAGPDFIDTGLHRLAAGARSRNLDQWMCGKDYVVDCYQKHASSADMAVVEGVMGMYDGDFNTAALARLLCLPVLLVVDAYGMAESAGAVVKGFVESGRRSAECGTENRSILFAGVVFNRVASESHYKRLKDSVHDIPVIGYLPRELNFEIPHRHLGLVTVEENPFAVENIDRLADTVLKFIDVDTVLREAKLERNENHREGAKVAKETKGCNIAVAYDKAFCFYYEDNFDLLRDAGAEIVWFSPLNDRGIPDSVDAVYIGGGYPELHADVLAGNASMLASMREWSEAGKPMYAECGGLMYLSRGIRDFEDRFHTMVGVLPFETRMLKKPKLAYREIVLNEDCILGPGGERLRGHEFHYSEIVALSPQDRAPEACVYSLRDKNGNHVPGEGFKVRNTLASYIHVHFGSNRNIANRLAGLAECRK